MTKMLKGGIVNDQQAEEFAPLLNLVQLATARQHGSITRRQYDRLRRKYLSTRPKPSGGLVMAWFYHHGYQLKSQLAAHGVTIRPEKARRPHLFKLLVRGFHRLGEIERKIEKSRKRRDLQLR